MLNKENKTSLTMNLTMTTVRKTKRTNKFHYPGYDPTFLAISGPQIFHFLCGIKL